MAGKRHQRPGGIGLQLVSNNGRGINTMENNNRPSGKSGQWTIGKRLSMAFGAMIVIVGVLGVTSYFGVSQLSSSVEEIW